MLSLYLIIAIICAILLMISVALGGLVDHVDIGGDFDLGGTDVDLAGPDIDASYGDFHGPGISPLSLPIILAFGTSFGGIGALFEELGLSPYLVPLIAALISLAIAGGMYFAILWIFVKTQTSSTVDLRGQIGKQAVVTVAIKEGKIGQVLVVTEERGRTLVHAISDENIPTDTTVEIMEIVGNSVKVKKR